MLPWNARQISRDGADEVVLRCTEQRCGKTIPLPRAPTMAEFVDTKLGEAFNPTAKGSESK